MRRASWGDDRSPRTALPRSSSKGGVLRNRERRMGRAIHRSSGRSPPVVVAPATKNQALQTSSLRSPRLGSPSLMDLRLRDAAASLEEVEIATLVGLPDVLSEQAVVAARIIPRRRRPRPQALGDLIIAQVQVN